MLPAVLTAGFFSLAAAGLLARPPVALISTLTVLFGLALLLELFRRQRLATLLLTFYLLYALVPVWAMQVLAGVPLSNWRGELFAPEALDGAVLYYCVGFSIFGLGVIAGTALWSLSVGARQPAPAPRPARSNWPALAALFLALLTAALFFGVARDSWIISASIADRFVMQASTIATIAAFGANLENLRRARRPYGWLDLLPLLVAAVIAVQGFRFMLVAGLVTLLVSLRQRLAIRPAALAGLGLAAVVAYVLLTAGMGVRAMAGVRGAGVLDAIAQLDPVYLSRFVGAPEQTGMVALKFYTETPVPLLHGRTYVDAILRILPNPVHTALFDTIRPQDYILAHFAWLTSWFQENQLNIGAHMFLETIVNFGVFGGLVGIAAIGALVPWVDIISARQGRFVPLLYGVATFAFAAAWYGSSNFFKYTAFYVAVFALLGALQNRRIG